MPRIALTTLLVRDYDEALDFYLGRMGFSLVEDTPLSDGKRWVVVSPDPSGPGLLLARATDARQARRIGDQAGGRVFLFLHSNDFAADHSRLLAAGVRFTEPPREERYGPVAVFLDLYGNRWDLIGAAAPAA